MKIQIALSKNKQMKTFNGLDLIITIYTKSRWIKIEYLNQEYSFFPTGIHEFKKYCNFNTNDWLIFLKQELIK